MGMPAKCSESLKLLDSGQALLIYIQSVTGLACVLIGMCSASFPPDAAA